MIINYTYDEMINKTIDFYNTLGIKIPKKHIKRAVESLTMPDFAHMFNDERFLILKNAEIKDHRALATVGDAVCEAYLMIKYYHENRTMASLTYGKIKLENYYLNIVGKNLLENKLFSYNNDLKSYNTKDYATAFEAVVGFISLLNINKAFKILDTYLV